MLFLLILWAGKLAVKQARLSKKVQMGRPIRVTGRLALAYGLSLGIGLAMLGCTMQSSSPPPAALIDEAFATLFPDTAEFLARRPGLLSQEKSAQDSSSNSSTPANGYNELANLPDFAQKLLLKWQTDASTPKVLIASPLAAAQLTQTFLKSIEAENRGETGNEGLATPSGVSTKASVLPHLVVPFGKSIGLSGLDFWSIEYDYSQAYADLGRKAAEIVVEKTKKQGSTADKTGPYCLVVFQENLLRGKEALDAFTKNFSSLAGESALKIELLPDTESAVDFRGAFEQVLSTHLRAQLPDRPSLVVLGIDDAFAAEEAARGSLGSSGQLDALKPLFMADCGSWGKDRADRRLFVWRIEADGRNLGEKAYSLATALVKGRKAERISLVPLRLLAGSRIF